MGLFQINIVIGILLAYLSNAIVAHLVPALDMQWRWQFGVGVLPAVLFLLLLLLPLLARAFLCDFRVVEEAAGAGLAGGAIYDALLGYCALKAKADVLYTWNARDFLRLPPAIANRVKIPGA